MTHSYDDHAELRPRTRAERTTALAVGAVLAVAGTVSLIHLIDQYNKAGPYREARAAESERARQEREAERERRLADEEARSRIGSGEALPPALSVEPANPTLPSGTARLEDLPPETRREIERRLAEERMRTPLSSTVRPAQPLRWSVPPSWPTVRGDAFPEGVSEMSVQFRCRVTRGGLLSDCASTEQPAGTGLAALMRPALDRARAEPARIDGQVVESRISFGVAFTAPPRRVVVPPPPTRPRDPEAPPAYVPTSPLPSADRLTTPPPVPAPEG